MSANLLALLLLLGLAFGWIRTANISHAYSTRHRSVIAEPPLLRFPARVVRILTLGHFGLYEDILHIWMLQIFESDAFSAAEMPAFGELILRAVKMHPRIESFYLLNCLGPAFRYGVTDTCPVLGEEGIKALPTSWRILIAHAIVKLIASDDKAGAKELFLRAATVSDAPEAIKVNATRAAERLEREDESIESFLRLVRSWVKPRESPAP